MNDERPPVTSRCPICGAPTAVPSRPFCSKRCADVDLLRWLRGGYVIAGQTDDDDEDGITGDLGLPEDDPPKRPS